MHDHSDGEIARIDDDLHRAFRGGAWHGPPLCAVLEGVTAEQAGARPIPGGHSIWELVVHLSAWDEVVTRRLVEGRAIELPDGGNFPPFHGFGPAAWGDALRELDRRHTELREAIGRLASSGLSEPVAGKGYAVAHMLHGVVQHIAYHAGQIALLRKALEPPPTDIMSAS